MTGPNYEPRELDDHALLTILDQVEPHDFDRIAPPSQVWHSLLAEIEEELAVIEAANRRRPSPWNRPLVLAAAAIVAVMGVAAVLLSLQGRSDDPTPIVALASMTNADLPVATDESAEATVRCEDDSCWVEVELTGVPESNGDLLELWVINSDVTDMHSLGFIEESGEFPLPAGASVSEFPIIDISIEPDDGVPTHSGNSVLRGTLEPS